MTDDTRLRANRLNAQKSTGPKTVEGKRRAAKNARRHGLSLPVTADPELSEDVVRLARTIAGEGASPRLLEAARRIAEPQIDLMRLRRARLILLNDPLDRTTQLNLGEKLGAATLAFDTPADPKVPAQYQVIADGQSGEKASALELGLDELTKKLMRLDRYERRALSRRKKAIRTFDLTFPPVRHVSKKDKSATAQTGSVTTNSQRLAGEVTP